MRNKWNMRGGATYFEVEAGAVRGEPRVGALDAEHRRGHRQLGQRHRARPRRPQKVGHLWTTATDSHCTRNTPAQKNKEEEGQMGPSYRHSRFDARVFVVYDCVVYNGQAGLVLE